MGERRLQQIGRIVTDKLGVCHVRIINNGWVEQRRLYLVCCNQLDHASKEQTLQFEPALVIGVRQDEEGVLQDAEIVLLEELVGYLSVCGGKIVDNFQAHCRKT